MDTTQKDLTKARKDLAADMEARGIGAIIWDNATAGFHYLPEIAVPENKKEDETLTIEGLYLYEGKVYLIVEGKSTVSIDNLYDADTEVRPTVVTLGPSDAVRLIGNPKTHRGYITGGTTEEWLTIADCYFEALNLEEEE